MSDTPRCDEATVYGGQQTGTIIPVAFAQQLERELSKAVAALEFIRDAGGMTSDDAEFGQINYNGSWCAEQAQAALYSIANNAVRVK